MMSLVDIWCLLVILCLPVLGLVELEVGGLYLSPVDLLFPILVTLVLITLASGKLKMFRHQKLLAVLLLALLIYQFLDVVLLQGDAVLRYLKLLLSQALGFSIYYAFSRVSSRARALWLAESLVWTSAAVALWSIGVMLGKGDLRLDSALWGKSNAFAAALTIPALVGIALVGLYHCKRAILPFLVNAAGILATQSRGGIVVLVLGAGILWGIVRGKHTLLRLALAGTVVAVLLVGCGSLPAVQRSIPVFERLADDIQALRDYAASGSDYDLRRLMSGRLFVWQSAVQTISQSPFLGSKDRPVYVPPEPGLEPRLVEREEFSYHSWLLNITAWFGIVGLVLNLLVLITALSPLVLRSSSIRRREAQAFLVILSTTLIHGLAEPTFEAGFFTMNIISMMFWIVAGLSLRLVYIPQEARA